MIKRFKEELNIHAYVREYLLILIRNFSMNNSTDMIFYSSILAKLTEISNQLTLNASVDDQPIFYSSSFSLCLAYCMERMPRIIRCSKLSIWNNLH